MANIDSGVKDYISYALFFCLGDEMVVQANCETRKPSLSVRVAAAAIPFYPQRH